MQQKEGNNVNPPKFDVVYNTRHTCNVVGLSSPSTTDSSPPSSENEVAADSFVELANKGNNRADGTITDFELEELLSFEPDRNMPPTEDVIPNILTSWDFSAEWNNIDELLCSNADNLFDEGRAF